MITIQESGMTFGNFDEKDIYKIENSAGHQGLGDGFKIVEFTYLRMPRTPVYGTIIDEDTDLEVYDPNTSVNFEYPEDCFNEIVTLCLGYTGVNLRSADIVQYSQMLKEKGI